MKAIVVDGLRSMAVKDVARPDIEPGSMLIKVDVCAVCGSDVRIFESGNTRVEYPAIIGHEIAGTVVEKAEDVDKYKVGDRVALGADVPCGVCRWCQNGMANCCDTNYAIGYQFQGGFAEYCLINPTVLRYGPVALISESVDSEHAALAEPLACCINGLERVNFSPGKSVLIIGSGPIGILLMLTARAFGSPLTVLADIAPQRLKMAEPFGPDHIIDSGKEDLKERIMELTGGAGIDSAFIACPSPDAQEHAVSVLAKRGYLNFFGGLSKGSRDIIVNSNEVHYKELYLTGSHGSVPRQHALAMDLIASGRIDVSDLITHRFGLADIHKAFDTVKNGEGLKVLVKPGE
ncbi:alcohol dehydrogenase catalytic domain-containing protein [Candidatus Margulisiibacteriota bacterium]